MKPRDVLSPHKKKAKHLWSGKSYNDLTLADASNASSEGHYSSPLVTPRSHSYGASFSQSAAQRIALGATHPHSADAYELINKCGHGATAEVWRAHCKPIGDDVAIKIVNLEKAGRSMETILHEAQLLCGLRHSHIVPLLSCFTKDENLWMVLPYVEGGSVESAMKYAFPQGLPERVIAPIVLPILKALSYLHKHDIVHRDVKASNILLDCNNILLGDFGTAAAIERSLTSDGKTAFGHYLCRTTYVGTPAWMAPEVIEQCREGHSTKADIYSFGVTLLEMARGKVPFAGVPLEVIAMNKLHHPSPSLPASYEGRTFSAEMQDIVALCLEKCPQKRPSADQLLKHRFFKNAKNFRGALEEILNGVPGPVQRLSSLTRRSTENLLNVGEEAASYAADERVSLKTQKSKEARLATRFDAETALGLLNKMLVSPNMPGGTDGSSGDSPDSFPGSSASSASAVFGSTHRRLSFTKKKLVAQGALWPYLPPSALKYCRGILFASASRKGFGLQTIWGHAFVMSHIDLGGGKTCWSGPCYCYMSGNPLVGLGDNTRESIVLYSGNAFRERMTRGIPFKLSGMQLVDAMQDSLDLEGICEVLKDEASPCEGVAFRHYTSHKSWKAISGVVHVDHVANERLYGKPVTSAEILNGIQHGLEHNLSIGSAMSGVKVGDSPGTSPRDGDTAFGNDISYEPPTPPVSSFAENHTFLINSDRGSFRNHASLSSWANNGDDDSGTPPPDSFLQDSPYSSGSTDEMLYVHNNGPDVNSLPKGDSALDLACMYEEGTYTRGNSPLKVIETFRSTSPFARSSSQEVKVPAADIRDVELSQRPSRPFSPVGPNPKPPKHPRSLSQAMSGLKL